MISLHPKRITQFLIFVVLGLNLASLTGQFYKYSLDSDTSTALIQKLNVDGEYTIPSIFSSCALLSCSIILAKIAVNKNKNHDQYTRHWFGLSIIFLYLAIDETISLHEQLIPPLRKALNAGGLFHYTWVIPGIIFVLVILLLFWQFLRHLPTKIRNLFWISGGIFVGGAIGMEMISGYYTDLYNSDNITYAALTTLEELLEMLGIVIFIHALLSYLKLSSKIVKTVSIPPIQKDS